MYDHLVGEVVEKRLSRIVLRCGGVGYEWRLGKRWWIGPEATLVIADGEGNLGTEFLPQLGLNLVFDF